MFSVEAFRHWAEADQGQSDAPDAISPAMVEEKEARETAERIYNVIYADTPPRFEIWSEMTGMDCALENYHDAMTIEAIVAIGETVPAARDCVLYLWATAPLLRPSPQ